MNPGYKIVFFMGFDTSPSMETGQDSYQSRAKFNTEFSNNVSFATNKVYGSKVNVSHYKNTYEFILWFHDYEMCQCVHFSSA